MHPHISILLCSRSLPACSKGKAPAACRDRVAVSPGQGRGHCPQLMLHQGTRAPHVRLNTASAGITQPNKQAERIQLGSPFCLENTEMSGNVHFISIKIFTREKENLFGNKTGPVLISLMRFFIRAIVNHRKKNNEQ